jgi:hypothetical protein
LAQLASREADEPYVIHMPYKSASRTTNDRVPIALLHRQALSSVVCALPSKRGHMKINHLWPR